MAEPGRTQLQMMLVQQAGPGSLPLSILSPQSFLPFLRTIEQLTVDEHLAPVIVYWSRQSAARLLPAGQRYRELMQDAFCVSIFSEDRPEPPDEWCFLIESRGLCLIVYGQQVLESPVRDKYQCSGSMDPQIVRQAFNRLLPMWQFIDFEESNRLEDARVNLGPCGSAPPYVHRIRSAWPVVKAPIQQTLILQPADVSLSMKQDIESGRTSELGKIQPIAMQPTAHISAATSVEVTVPPNGEAANADDIDPEEFSVTQGLTTGSHSGLEAQPKGISDGRDNKRKKAPKARHEMKDLEAVPDGEEVPVMRPSAQAIIGDIIGQLRHSNDLSSILQFAIESLTNAVDAERGLIWQVVGDQLGVTNEYASSGHTCFVGNQLGSQESTAIVLEFLSRFPDASGAGVISIPNTAQDTQLHKMSPTLSSLIELGEVRARLMVQLFSRGIFSGFLELQQCSSIRQWSKQDAVVLQSVAEMLSVVVQQSFDQSKIEMDAKEMKLINEIASLFRESRGQTSRESLVKSVMLVAEHMGFTHSQIYLYDQEESILMPQIQDGSDGLVDLSMKDNPFVAVFESGRGKIINAEFTRKGDPFFGHDMALVLPLVSEGERLGVIGLWQRLPSKPQFRPQDRELGLTISGHLSNVIRADQAIMQVRKDQARAALINKVSSEIRQSLKEVDQIMETLVQSLKGHLSLELATVSLYNTQTGSFTKSKTAGEVQPDPEDTLPAAEPKIGLGERLSLSMLEELKQGHTIFLNADEIRQKLDERNINLLANFKSATLVPLVHAGNFKAALCMVSALHHGPLPEADMKMVADLADRVAVVVSHAELFVQVEQQAVTDPMTGLFNRRYFQEQLAKEIDRFQRFGHAFSFIIVDLDYLKKINDSLGHHFGDIAIKHIANVLKRNVRDVDTVGRFGGEEFVVLLPETDFHSARMVADRICSAIREKPLEKIGTITASLGMATFPYDAQDRDKLFELADEALFLAKHRGRNQVCSVSEDLMPTLKEGKESIVKRSEPVQRLERPKLRNDDYGIHVDLSMVAERGILGMLAQVVKAVEERDAYGSDRSPRAYEYANGIAQALHLSKEHSEFVALAAILSNLGKIVVPEEILRKPGPLNEEEMELVKQGPEAGAKLLEPSKLLYRVSSIIESYHEHFDGTGYPKGLKGSEIPLESRIIALINAYTAMTSKRPYRESMSKEDALKAIQDGSGKEWDPRIVKIFVSVLRKGEPKSTLKSGKN